MLNFCTLFDSNYAAKGLVMYSSLLKHCENFHLYIFAFDDLLYDFLKSEKLNHITVISLNEFENEELLRVKPTRTKAEYCWTSTSSTISYCFDKFGLDNCTYLDADLYFYSNPVVLIEEMGDNDVLITSHRYTPQFDVSSEAGKYCVQFMTFKNTLNGLKVLNWWKNACIDWCYARVEDGKFGDQKYLDDWTTRFEGVHELEHLGGGVAPWNMQQYCFTQNGKEILGKEITTRKEFKLIFFHFHAIYSYKKVIVREFYYEGYPLDSETRRLLYTPYTKQLYNKNKYITTKSKDGLATKTIDLNWFSYLKRIRKRFLSKNNRYNYFIEL
jgi:hypothetical protein